MFIVYYIGHVDCYKRADSYGNIWGVYNSKEKAYEMAVRLQINYLEANFGIKKVDYKVLSAPNKSYEEKYNYIHSYDNEESLFGYKEFTMHPTREIYYVEEVENFQDNMFEKDIENLKKIEDIKPEEEDDDDIEDKYEDDEEDDEEDDDDIEDKYEEKDEDDEDDEEDDEEDDDDIEDKYEEKDEDDEEDDDDIEDKYEEKDEDDDE